MTELKPSTRILLFIRRGGASTNLVLELEIVLWVLAGWCFTLGNILLDSS